jgi:2,5-dihydroxypyridine 5,6-dioxygenase
MVIPIRAEDTAILLLGKLGRLRQGDRMLLLHDQHTSHHLPLMQSACRQLGATCHTLGFQASPGHGAELPAHVAQAMLEADLVVGLTRGNITHTNARRTAQTKGVHVIALPECDGPDFFTLQGWTADFDALAPEIEAVARALTNARQAVVTSTEGTHLTLSIEGRQGRALTGFVNPRDISAGYGLEASIAPVEGTANGRIVVNESIPGVLVIGDDPVIIELENGYARHIHGGPNARKFAEFMASFNDPEVYNLGELGIGMNPACEPDGIMLTDENVYGNIQLALGTSAYIGGTVKAAAHYDTISHGATISLDGKVLLEGNRIFLD